MELGIGKKIYDLRKEKGITQEQMASRLGVSTPSVSKWETGNSYPDITLLIRIARYFDTSVDNLLAYSSTLSDTEVLEINKEFERIFESDGLKKAIDYLDEFLIEYPNCNYLKYRASGMLQQYAGYSGKDEERIHLYERAIQLADDVANSTDPKLISAAQAIEASLYMTLEKYELAENILKQIDKPTVDPDFLLPSLYMLQDRIEEAESLHQKNLYKNITGAVNELNGLVTVARKKNDTKLALKYLEIEDKIIELFHLEDILMLNTLMMKLMIYSDIKDVKNTLAVMKDYLYYINKFDWDDYDISKNEFFQTIKPLKIWKSSARVKEGLIKELIENPRYDYVRGEEEFKSYFSKYKIDKDNII